MKHYYIITCAIAFFTIPVLQAQNVGVGENSPATKLEIKGDAGTDLFNVKDQNENSRFYIENTGDVGIGTTNPTERLEVAGNLKVMGLSGSGTVNVIVDNTGKLSIGSSDIGDITDVSAGVGLVGGGSTGSITIDLVAENGLTDFADKVELGGALTKATTITQGAYDMTYDLTGTGDFKIMDGGATRMIIEDGGNVGIGISLPSVQLHTSGVARFDGGVEVDGSTVIEDGAGWHNSYGNTGWRNQTYGGGIYMSDATWIRTYGSKSFYHNSGNMRTDGTLQVGSSGSTLNVPNNGNFAYRTNTLFANTAGNVGIGTANPGQSLDVVGNTRTSGDFIGRIAVEDTRATDAAPTTYDREVHFEFKQRAAVGVNGSGTYSGMMTIAPWSDDSGDAHHQLNFNEGGIFWRQGQPNSSSWGSWDQLMTASNVNSFVNGDNLGNHSATTSLDMNSNNINEVNRLSGVAASSYDKLRVWNSSNYTIGMVSGQTLGYLNDYAMTFTMNTDADRGFLWRDVSDASSDGAMSLTTDGRLYLKGAALLNGAIRRTDHNTGFLEGSYNNVGANDTKTNPIYTIGSNYSPTTTGLSNMYGIGYSHSNFWGTSSAKPSGWGQYVAADGNIRIILEASNGRIWASGDVRAPVYYDQNNTGYYVDPSSNSVLNTVKITGGSPDDGKVLTSDASGNATWQKEGKGEYNSGSVTAGNWYRIATNPGNRANAEFTLRDVISGGGHSTLKFIAGISYGDAAKMAVTVLSHSVYSTPTFSKIRILESGTYDTHYLEVYCSRSGSVNYSIKDNLQSSGWTPVDWTAGSIPSGYTSREFDVDDLFMVGDYSERFTIERGGQVGIGTANPSYTLEVNGKIKSAGIHETSDQRLKMNIKGIKDALKSVLQMRGVTYDWRIDDYPEMNLEEGKQYGLIAQELEKVLPELVETDEQGYKSIQYTHLIPLLIEALKAQQQIINEKEQQITNIQTKSVEQDDKIDQLSDEMSQLKQILGM